MSHKVRMRVAYEGTRYHGWQYQPHAATVEGELRRACAKFLNVAEAEVQLQGASRTDAGVHALGQTAHLIYDAPRSCWDVARALNALTPDDICVVRVEPASEDFHARHSARGKIYRYRLWRHRFANPLQVNHRWHVRHPLDLSAMAQAGRKLVGEHDFAAFRASDCQSATTVRHIQRVELEVAGPELIVWVEGSAFLKYMVRNIVGTLVMIGEGRAPVSRMDELLASGDRQRGGQTAPPGGLTLMTVHYPEHPWQADDLDLGCDPV